MFQYEFEKRPPSAGSCDSRAPMTTDWGRGYPTVSRALPTPAEDVLTVPRPGRVLPNAERARRPLPPRPIPICETIPSKTTVPLKVWVIASASCFAVCAVLVLATVVITKWGTGTETYTAHEIFEEIPEPIYSKIYPKTTTESTTDDISNDIDFLQKLSIFNNKVGDRSKKMENLSHKPQIHPIHETLEHAERKIEKKDRAKTPNKTIPEFKPTLPDVFVDSNVQLPDGFVFKKVDEYDYYNEDNLYEDYAESNSMTNYLIEKVQELYDWITTDPDLKPNDLKKKNSSTEFGQLLKALNESLVEGNVTIIMNKLKDIYFGENYTSVEGHGKKILSHKSDLLSFGILTLDVMLLHNIQLMAWESQESVRNRMLKEPDVFAFNALFLDPTKVEAKQNEVFNNEIPYTRRQNYRQESIDDFDVSKNLLENVLEIGMSTARAAIHLGRAYKNTKTVLNQLSNKEVPQIQMSRNIGGNSHALNHLQTSFNDSYSVANTTAPFYTELDCVWLLYCRNLAATAKLNAPYGTMARINSVALRMLNGELSADRALNTLLYEALAGWTDLKCNDMFPRCSKVNAASIVINSILQPIRKSQTTVKNR